MNDATPLLAVDDLGIGYAGADGEVAAALRGVSLRLGPGEAYGLAGESGCGKSTLALALLGFLADNARRLSGTVRFRGEDLYALTPARLRQVRGAGIAMVHQSPAEALNPTLSIGRQLREAQQAHERLSRREADARSVAMLARVHLGDPAELLGRYPHQLSGGQAQRCVIAMALLARPALLVLDEPTTGLDVTVAAAVVALIRELGRDLGTALVYISHDLGLLGRVCGRIGVMYAGELVEEAPAGSLFASPRHPYTAGLLACRPDPRRPAAGRRLVPIPGQPPAPGGVPAGCPFAPRCPSMVADPCEVRAPSPAPTGAGGFARCWFADGVRVEGLGGAPRVAPAGDAPVLTVAGLDKVFERRRFSLRGLLRGRPTVAHRLAANRGVDLGVRAGVITAIVGESGSGKSTLARILVGLETASGGSAVFRDTEIASRPVRRRPRALIRGIQMVFQHPDATLNPRRRVAAIIARAVRRLREGSGAAVGPRVEELMAAVQLGPELATRRPAGLSGGQRQRVAIARALAGNPEILIADEPVSALDLSVQAAIVNLLLDRRDAHGTSIVFISHDLGLVRHLADEVLVLYRGVVLERGPVEAIFNPPHHPYTQVLLAALGDAPVITSGAVDAPRPDEPGCPFAGRCPRKLGPICDTEAPPRRMAGDGHEILCHIPLETLTFSQPLRTGSPPHA